MEADTRQRRTPRLWRILERIITPIVGSDPIAAKALGNLIAVCYGAAILFPGTSFAINPPFRFLALIFSEWEFGLVLVLSGLAGILALSSQRRPWIRRLALWHVFVWSFLTYIFFVGAPSAPAWGFTLGLTAGMMWAYVRLR